MAFEPGLKRCLGCREVGKSKGIFHAEGTMKQRHKAENHGHAWRDTFMKESDVTAGQKDTL